jgi:flagellar protein FlbD
MAIFHAVPGLGGPAARVFGSRKAAGEPKRTVQAPPLRPPPGPIEQEDRSVIRVTRLNGERFALNPDLIERVEGHPDTVAFLVDGTKYVVKESVDEVLDEIREYRAGILATSYEMDRGEYRSSVSAEPPSAVDGGSSVVPFPSREER